MLTNLLLRQILMHAQEELHNLQTLYLIPIAYFKAQLIRSYPPYFYKVFHDIRHIVLVEQRAKSYRYNQQKLMTKKQK